VSKKNAFALAFSCLLGFAVACSNQGEGERCNSDDDCATNLTCVTRTIFTDTSTRVCCPAGASSSDFCQSGDPGLTNPDAAGPIDVPDTGTEDSGTEDSGSEPDTGSSSGGSSSSSGGDSDASSDASTDAADAS
jgi:hypothetical protein